MNGCTKPSNGHVCCLASIIWSVTHTLIRTQFITHCSTIMVRLNNNGLTVICWPCIWLHVTVAPKPTINTPSPSFGGIRLLFSWACQLALTLLCHTRFTTWVDPYFYILACAASLSNHIWATHISYSFTPPSARLLKHIDGGNTCIDN